MSVALDNGNYKALANGPLKKERYVNERMEEELTIFKAEVERRFKETSMPKDYKFPRKTTAIQRANSGEALDWEVSENSPIAEPMPMVGSRSIDEHKKSRLS